MSARIVKPVPTIPPPSTVVIELTTGEAKELLKVLGGACSLYSLYNDLQQLSNRGELV